MKTLKPRASAGVGRACLFLFGTVWTAFSCFFLIAPLGMLLFNPKHNWVVALPTALFSLPFIAVGLGMIAYSILPWIAGMRVSNPDVTISSSSLRVGDRFTIAYAQTFKRGSEVKRINFSLLQRETVRYQQGDSTATVHHDETAAEFEYPAQRYEAGDSLAFSRSMEIPRTGMHTFHATHNDIAWLLEVKVDIAGWPDYREAFDIQVAPLLAR
jgi:hypothetical protein